MTLPSLTLPSFAIVFGGVASFLFISSHLPMLARAARTKDLRSYSFTHLLLSNLGNLCYWVYVSTLPFGPIWVMHAFYTVAAALMLGWYLRHVGLEPRPSPGSLSQQGKERRAATN